MEKSKSNIFKVSFPKGRTDFIIIAVAAFIMAAGIIVSISETATAETTLKPPMNLWVSSGPRAGAEMLDADGGMRIGEADRCPVCAMLPIKYPKFSSAIRLQNGATYYFCGTGCMIKSWMHPEVFLGVPKTALDRPVIREYFTGRQMDAREVSFVAGSDVIGPMGPALIPVSSDNALDTFKKRHGWKSVFRLDDMTDARWLETTGKKVVP